MQSKRIEQKNEIIALLGLENKIGKIEERNGYFVISGVENLDSHKQEIAIVLEKYPIRFERCVFDFLVVENRELNNPIGFVDCKFKQVNFKKTKFRKYVSFQESTFVSSVDFSDCRFFEEVNFSSAHFENSDKNSQNFLKFSRSKFKQEANFSNVYFGKDTYFHRCVFYSDLQIYRSRFDAVANFYFAIFDNGGMPNFSTCVFENPKLANFVGVDLTEIQKKDIEDYVKRKARDEVNQEENKKKNRTEEELRVQHAKNIKDSFRVVKDVLLAQNNKLEAQIWHKLELYAKEIELEFLIEENQKARKWNYKKLDLMFDKNILYLYRLISDHHNNFSQILSVTIYAIVFHNIFIWIFYFLFTNFFSSNQLINLISRFAVYVPLGAITFLMLVILVFNFIRKRFLSSLVLNIMTCICCSFATIIFFIASNKSLSIFSGFVFAMICVYCFLFFFTLPWLKSALFRIYIYALLICVFIPNPNILNPFVGIFKEDPLTNIIIKNYINQSDPEKIQVMLSKCNWADKRFGHDLKEYSSLKNTLISNARLILDMCNREETKKENNVKNEDKSSNELELILVKNEIFNQVSNVISIIYLIMLVLLIFSLQKTARKNSIIPS